MERAAGDACDDVQVFLRPVVELVGVRADQVDQIHQDARVYAALLDGDDVAELNLAAGRRAYVHVARGAARVNGTELGAGDAAKITGESTIVLDRGEDAEVLVFDLA